MSDMRNVIKPKSDQLNADDLIGSTLTIKVTGVNIASTEQPVSIRFEGDDNKPYKPCKSMCRVLVQVWGPDARQYVGKSMTLYRDPDVTWGGMKVGGIRISHMSHIDKPVTMALTASKSKRAPYTVKPLSVNTAAAPAGATKAEVDALAGYFDSAKDQAEVDEAYEKLKAAWKRLDKDQRDIMTAAFEGAKKRIAEPPADDGSTPADDQPPADEDRPKTPDEIFPGDIPEGMTKEEFFDQAYGN